MKVGGVAGPGPGGAGAVVRYDKEHLGIAMDLDGEDGEKSDLTSCQG